MKSSLYITAAFFITGLHGAAQSDIIQQVPATVCDVLIHTGIVNVSKQNKAALASPVGRRYVFIDESPKGINCFSTKRPVIEQTNIYTKEIHANKTLETLASIATTLAESGAPEAERVIGLLAFGSKYGRLLKKLTEKDIPGLKLRPTLEATIEKNTTVTLDDKQEICLEAAQLAMGLNLQEQYDIDPTTFSVMFKRYLTSSSSSSSSTKTPTTTSNSTSGAGWWPW